MRKIWILGLVGVLALVLAGCGGGDSGRDFAVRDIFSMGGADDGDIGRDASGVYTVFTSNSSPNTVIVTDDPADSHRGFLSFSLTSIPIDASIQSARILLPILRATPVIGVSSVGLLVDMVTFPPLDTLVTQTQRDAVYFTTPILLGPSVSVFPGDAGTDISVDATDALIEANRLGFSTLQVRLIGVSGDVVIDDLLDVNGNGTPLLRVRYF